MVTLLYFARLRETLGISSEQVELPAQVNNIRSLSEWLRQRGKTWEQALSLDGAVRVAVNQDMANSETAIHDGDEIAFFPPVTGG